MALAHDDMPVLLITTEYGAQLFGGLGRVVNGLLAEDVARNIDVLLVGASQDFVHGPVLELDHSDFESTLRSRDYRIVHPLCPNDMVAAAVTRIREVLPHAHIVFSCHSIKDFEKNIRAEAKPATVRAEQYLIGEADWLHVLNDFSLAKLRASYPKASTTPTTIIPNGIEEESLLATPAAVRQLRQCPKLRGKRVILSMTRWAWGKGLEYLAEAIPLVLKQRDDVVFVIGGRKESSWEFRSAEYVAMIDRRLAPYRDHVVSPGWVDDRARNAYLALADIFVMPSQLEYFPYSILEPMMAGTPIVSANVGGVPEMIEGGRECLLYAPENSAMLADHILELLSNESKAQAFSKRAREHARRSYPWTAIAEQYLQMYASAVARFPRV
jgi:glycosyltransferase involved in cell wall biosynthesis